MCDISEQRMNREDYPQLYRAADALSIKYQKRHYILLALYLGLLIVGTCLSFGDATICTNSIALVVFILSAVVYIFSKLYNPLSLWYNGRAVAESVKSMTWKWMMMASPYNYQPYGCCSRQLIQDLRELLKENKPLFIHYQDEEESDRFYTISQKMKEVRHFSSSQKLVFYNKNRVDEQLRWYRRNAKYKHRYYLCYSSFIGCCYVVVVVLMIMSIVNPEKSYPVEILATVIAASISWLEAKNYNELSNAYSLAVSDISLIKKDPLEGQVSEDEVSEYVINSENAFSREHTQWLARKNN